MTQGYVLALMVPLLGTKGLKVEVPFLLLLADLPLVLQHVVPSLLHPMTPTFLYDTFLASLNIDTELYISTTLVPM